MDRDAAHWARDLAELKAQVGACDTSASIDADRRALRPLHVDAASAAASTAQLLLAPTRDAAHPGARACRARRRERPMTCATVGIGAHRATSKQRVDTGPGGDAVDVLRQRRSPAAGCRIGPGGDRRGARRRAARFADLRVIVKGRLIAEGNYFSRQSKLFVLDDGGRRLEVQPWLPKSAPPSRGDADPARTQADFLDHQVELTGVLRVGAAGNPAGNPPPGIRFEVTSARIVPP